MNLYVSNLNPETSELDLRRIFSEFGEIVSAKVIRDMATGESKGFGFVEMATMTAGHNAIDNLDSTFLQGNVIVVKPAKPNPAKSGGAVRKPYPPRRYNDGGKSGTDDFNRF